MAFDRLIEDKLCGCPLIGPLDGKRMIGGGSTNHPLSGATRSWVYSYVIPTVNYHSAKQAPASCSLLKRHGASSKAPRTFAFFDSPRQPPSRQIQAAADRFGVKGLEDLSPS